MTLTRKKFVTCLAVMALSFTAFSTSAFAATKSWTNNTLTNWDKPISGTFTAEKISSTQAYNELDFWWSASQVEYMSWVANYPTFDFRDNGKSALDSGGGASSNLPDPKFDFEDDNSDGRVDEIEVVAVGKGEIRDLVDYNFYASWSKSGSSNPYMIAYSSMSGSPLYPGGDFNTIPNSTDSLAGHYWNDLSTRSTLMLDQSYIPTWDEKRQILNQIELQSNDSEEQVVSPAYKALKTADDIASYISQADSALSSAVDQEYKYKITFNKPLTLEEVTSINEQNKLASSVFYARAFNDKGDRVTIALNGLNEDVLNQIVENQNLDFKGFIEIEGQASSDELKKARDSEANIFSVEIGTDGIQPNGLYWKLENTRN